MEKYDAIRYLSSMSNYIQEFLLADPMFISNLCVGMQMDLNDIYDIVDGTKRITPEWDGKMCRFLHQNIGFWLKLQDICDGYRGVLDAFDNNRTIVFLDIDGVLNNYSYPQEMIEDKLYKNKHVWSMLVNRFNALCKSINASIVLSSTWRYSCNHLHDAREMLSNAGIESDCIGMTIRENLNVTRADAISEWICRKKADDCMIVVIDDEKYALPEYNKILKIDVDGKTGLTDDDCNEIISKYSEWTT